MGAIEK